MLAKQKLGIGAVLLAMLASGIVNVETAAAQAPSEEWTRNIDGTVADFAYPNLLSLDWTTGNIIANYRDDNADTLFTAAITPGNVLEWEISRIVDDSGQTAAGADQHGRLIWAYDRLDAEEAVTLLSVASGNEFGIIDESIVCPANTGICGTDSLAFSIAADGFTNPAETSSRIAIGVGGTGSTGSATTGVSIVNITSANVLTRVCNLPGKAVPELIWGSNGFLYRLENTQTSTSAFRRINADTCSSAGVDTGECGSGFVACAISMNQTGATPVLMRRGTTGDDWAFVTYDTDMANAVENTLSSGLGGTASRALGIHYLAAEPTDYYFVCADNGPGFVDFVGRVNHNFTAFDWTIQPEAGFQVAGCTVGADGSYYVAGKTSATEWAIRKYAAEEGKPLLESTATVNEPGFVPAAEADNILGDLVVLWEVGFGFDGSWIFGIALTAAVTISFARVGNTPLLTAIGALLGVGLAVALGLFPLWLILVLILLIIAVAGKNLFGGSGDNA